MNDLQRWSCALRPVRGTDRRHLSHVGAGSNAARSFADLSTSTGSLRDDRFLYPTGPTIVTQTPRTVRFEFRSSGNVQSTGCQDQTGVNRLRSTAEVGTVLSCVSLGWFPFAASQSEG
jgi:hypothetical protein